MATEFKKRFGAEVEQVDVGRGRFEVEVDGQEVFSKEKAGRYPRPGELTKT